jgi:hypothetical protein
MAVRGTTREFGAVLIQTVNHYLSATYGSAMNHKSPDS